MENVEDIYPLTPMQEMMLLHTLSRPHFDTLFSQFRFELHGPFESNRFRAAWQTLTSRHAALRTMFLWDNLKRPMQVVRNSVDLPYTYLDWADCPADQQRRRFDVLCADDRARTFDPTRAPLTRITVVRRNAHTHYLLWSSHHLIVDRWCVATLFHELEVLLGDTHGAVAASLPAPVPFSHYLRWLQNQDRSQTESFWRQLLASYPTPSLLTSAEPRKNDQNRKDRSLATVQQHNLSATTTDRLEALARQQGTTVGALAQCAWALTLNRFTKRQDVVFGTAVSGRPPDLVDVDQIVGSFVTNVPTRLKLGADQCLAEVVRNLQLQQQQRLRHEYISPADLQRWLELPADQVLFESIVVWLADTRPPQLPGIRVTAFPGDLRTAYPLTIGIRDRGAGYQLTGRLLGGCHLETPLEDLLAGLAKTLETLTRLDVNRPLAELPGFHGSLPFEHWHTTEPPGPHANGTHVRTTTAHSLPAAGREQLESDLLSDLLNTEWQEVLGVDTIDPQANFFEAGGDSLAAVKLHTRIEAATRQDIPIISLFQAPTLALMTQLLVERDWPLKIETLTPLRQIGSQQPLFCIASPEVNTLGYTLVARHLSEDQPVYVLQAPPDSDDLGRLSPALLPALAADYVAEMRRVQPDGPYRLLGMCTGSHIALEMARLLEAQDAAVAFLGIVNTWAHFTVSRAYHLEQLLNRVRWYVSRINQIARQDFAGQRAAVRAMARVKLTPAQRPPPLTSTANVTSGNDASYGDQDWIGDLGWAHKQTTYVLNPVRVPITVFRIQRQHYWRTPDQALGWSRFSSGGACSIDLTTRDHHDILREPHVRFFTEQLDRALPSTGTACRDDHAPAW